MAQQAEKLNQVVDCILDQLALRLVDVLRHPQPGGKKIIIHITPDREGAWIELPPEVVEARVRRT